MLTASIIIGISEVSDSHDDKYKGDTLPRLSPVVSQKLTEVSDVLTASIIIAIARPQGATVTFTRLQMSVRSFFSPTHFHGVEKK
jgi:glucokinase